MRLRNLSFILFVFILSCTNGNIETDLDAENRNDTIFDINKNIETNLNTEIRNDTVFDINKNIKSISKFKNGAQTLLITFENNKIKRVIKYINVQGEIIPNQFIFLNGIGDTLKNKSLFYDWYYMSDTIKLGEKYEFNIILTGHIFESAELQLCEYDDKFNLTDSACDIIDMHNFQQPLSKTN